MFLEVFEKDTKYVNGNVDLLRANPGLSGRGIGGTLPPGVAGKNRLLQVEKYKDNMTIRIKNNNFGVLARLRGLPEKTDELRKCLHKLVELTRTESGCLSCEMIENHCDATEFTLLADWSQENDHNAHFVTDRIRHAMKGFHGLLTAELDLRKHVLRLNSIKYGTNSYCKSHR